MKAYTLDTNIFIRFFIKDIPNQFEEARKLFKQIEDGEAIGAISILVINEIIWILEHFYEIDRKQYLPQLLQLLALKNIKVIEIKKQTLTQTLMLMLQKYIDFTDAYLLKVAKAPIVSFDQKLLKLIKAS